MEPMPILGLFLSGNRTCPSDAAFWTDFLADKNGFAGLKHRDPT